MSERAATVIWHNPRCSKSRQTLQLLRDRGIEPEIVEYLNYPPSRAEIGRVLHLLGISARELMRKKEPVYRERDLAKVADEDQLIREMHHHPVLIERPVVIRESAEGTRAAIGRPPEDVLDIL